MPDPIESYYDRELGHEVRVYAPWVSGLEDGFDTGADGDPGVERVGYPLEVDLRAS